MFDAGTAEAACAAVARFAERFALPVATSFRRAHLFDPDHPCYAGDLGIGPNPKLLARVKGADVILLDEPTAGMSHAETERAVALIRRLTEGRTLLIVEHDMSVVFGLADHISVLVYGHIIASGTPEDIRNNPKVKEAYLGEEAA